jgi:hypothetical protein
MMAAPMTKKVLQLVDGCLDCPRRSYYSGGVYECTEAGTRLPHRMERRDERPVWCPLIDYPSGLLAERDETIAELQRQLLDARTNSPKERDCHD